MFIAAAVFLFCMVRSASAQTPAQVQQETNSPTFKSMIVNIPSDLKDWWNITFSEENLPNLVGVLSLTGALLTVDYEAWHMVYTSAENKPSYKKFYKDAEMLSTGIFQIGSSVFMLGWGLSGNSRAMRTAFEIGETVLASGVIVQIMKRATGRESPSRHHRNDHEWHSYPGETTYRKNLRDYDAMPSGHMSSAFAVFRVIELNYSEQKWIPYVGYPMMAIMTLGCVGTNIHWWSDFPIAFALGNSFAKIVHRRYSPKEDSGKATALLEPNIGVGVSPYGGTQLVTANWRF